MKPLLAALLFFALAAPAGAQTLLQDTIVFVKAEVLEIVSQEEGVVEGTETPAIYQTLKVKILEGAQQGKVVEVQNDYLELGVGEVFYLRHTIDGADGREFYAVSEPYRLPMLALLCGFFLVCLVIFGGKQGVRGLLALIASLFCIVYLLLPGIMSGYPPVLVSLAVSALIIVAGSYITHGVNRTTSSAVLGMIATILFTGLLAHLSIYATRLSGYTNEEAVYLNFSTQGSIDFVGLLLGGLLIGLLGVLYDAAISQAIAVEELSAVGPHLTRRELFLRGLRIGREHIGALVNTLAIAYAGISLPLLLLLTTVQNQSILVTLNQELFATEIVRMMVGSIGIILAVPITTAVAVYFLYGRVNRTSAHAGHTHG